MADYMPFGVGTPQEVGAQEPNVLDRLIAGIINGTVSLPKHVIEATQATAPGLRREDFTDIPGAAQPGAEMRQGALEAAMMTMGATPFGMAAPRAGEMALGAGPVRPPPRYTREALEKMDINDLDRMAFGYVDGQKMTVAPKDLKIKYADDLENPQYKFDKGDAQGRKGMDWARSVDFSEPVQLSVGRDGKLYLEDGHHRYFAAQKLGKKLPAEISKIEGKPIEEILKRQGGE